MIRLDLLVAGRVGHPAPRVRGRHAVRGRLLLRRRGRPPRVADGGGQRGEPGLGPAVPPRDVRPLLLLGLRLRLTELGGQLEVCLHRPRRLGLGLPRELRLLLRHRGLELRLLELLPLRLLGRHHLLGPQLGLAGAELLSLGRGRGGHLGAELGLAGGAGDHDGVLGALGGAEGEGGVVHGHHAGAAAGLLLLLGRATVGLLGGVEHELLLLLLLLLLADGGGPRWQRYLPPRAATRGGREIGKTEIVNVTFGVALCCLFVLKLTLGHWYIRRQRPEGLRAA